MMMDKSTRHFENQIISPKPYGCPHCKVSVRRQRSRTSPPASSKRGTARRTRRRNPAQPARSCNATHRCAARQRGRLCQNRVFPKVTLGWLTPLSLPGCRPNHRLQRAPGKRLAPSPHHSRHHDDDHAHHHRDGTGHRSTAPPKDKFDRIGASTARRGDLDALPACSLRWAQPRPLLDQQPVSRRWVACSARAANRELENG